MTYAHRTAGQRVPTHPPAVDDTGAVGSTTSHAARAGAWVEFDGINAKSAGWHLDCLQFMASKDLLGHTLISQDSGWYHVGESGGGEYRGYTYIYTDFLPRLEPAWIQRLMIDNPAKAF